jgi:hypothetical protein
MFNLCRDKIANRWEVITHCRSQIIIYSYQNLITSSSSIYTSVLNTIICNIWVWRVQLIYEDPEESSATGPIWESCGLYTASFGNFKLRLFISSSSSVIVLLAQHDANTLMVSILYFWGSLYILIHSSHYKQVSSDRQAHICWYMRALHVYMLAGGGGM